MASIKSRHEKLKKLNLIPLFELLDEDEDVEYTPTFDPATGMVVIRTIGGDSGPPIAVSFSQFIRDFSSMPLKKQRKIDRVLCKIKEAWAGRPKSERRAWEDSIPLNSMIVGGEYV